MQIIYNSLYKYILNIIFFCDGKAEISAAITSLSVIIQKSFWNADLKFLIITDVKNISVSNIFV